MPKISLEPHLPTHLLARPQDRELLNEALADGVQNLNQRQLVRLNADRALAIWDGEATDFSGLDVAVPDRHYLLGDLNAPCTSPPRPLRGRFT